MLLNNTVNTIHDDGVLPPLSPENESRKQEILDKLESGPWSDAVDVTLILTKKCNLRCGHCFVKEWLTWAAEPDFPMDKAIDWMEGLATHRGFSKGSEKWAALIGGEALTVPERLREAVNRLHDLGWSLLLTTNMTRLPDDYEFMRKCKRIQVSIDGLREDHDRQRGEGTFAQTCRNIRKLLLSGFDNVFAQASLPINYSPEKRVRFVESMVYLGIPADRLILGYVTTGYDQKDVVDTGKIGENRTELVHVPCCEYRVMSSFSITPEGDVFASYHGVGRDNHRLGTIDDNFDTITRSYRSTVGRAVWLNDEKCLSCPALELCWGMKCLQVYKYGNTPKPSDYCERDLMIELVDKHNESIASGSCVSTIPQKTCR